MTVEDQEHLHQLQAPPGTDQANFGEQSFRVDNDHTVDVPVEAVPGLVGQGGFVDLTEEKQPPAPAGFGRVKHHDPEASCGGEKQPDGSFLVPIAQVNELISHGFTPVE